MKQRILTFTLGLIFLLSGCASALSTPVPSSPTPNNMPRLDPSPTPSGSTLPLTCQVTDLNVYINEADGYCFAFPTRFTLQNETSDQPNLHGPAHGNSLEPMYATFGVEVTPAIPELTARGEAELFLKDFTTADIDSLAWNQIMVGGEWGWMVEPVPTMGAWRFVFVQHNGYLFRLSYWPVDIADLRADVDDLSQTTIGSFAFTK